MIAHDLADLVGARGPRPQYGRCALLALALVLADATHTVSASVTLGIASGGELGALFARTMLLQLLGGALRAVVLATLAVVLLRRMPNTLDALLALALVYLPLNRAVGLFTFALQGQLSGRPLGAWLLEPVASVSVVSWTLLFFGGLALGVRFVPWLGLGLFLGSLAGELSALVVRAALTFFLQGPARFVATVGALPLSLAHALVFAGVMALGLLSFPQRAPQTAPGVTEPPPGA